MASLKLELRQRFFCLVSNAFDLLLEDIDVDVGAINFPTLFDVPNRDILVASSFLRVIKSSNDGRIASRLELQEFSGFARFDDALEKSNFIIVDSDGSWDWNCDLSMAAVIAGEVLAERLNLFCNEVAQKKAPKSFADRMRAKEHANVISQMTEVSK